jgi:molybdenum cofactor cytidylyltransferase
MIAGLILAAGEGSRFGGPKQLAMLRGQPLIEHAIETMLAVPAIERIVVVLGAHAELVRERADLGGTEVIVADDWSEGMSASLRAGIAELADAEAVLITLADQPLITPQVLAAVLDLGERADATRATYDGRPGHPVLIRRQLFAEVAQLRGENGARDLLELVGVRTLECGHLASADDVDTRIDLETIAGKITIRTDAGR